MLLSDLQSGLLFSYLPSKNNHNSLFYKWFCFTLSPESEKSYFSPSSAPQKAELSWCSLMFLRETSISNVLQELFSLFIHAISKDALFFSYRIWGLSLY